MSFAVTLFGGPNPSARAARAHAMKNCITVIVAISRLLDRDLKGASRERAVRLESAASRLKELLADDLCEEAHDASLAPFAKPICVTSLVNSTIDRLADRAESAGVEIFVQCAGGSVLGDESALGEALFNLVGNAIEATTIGGGVFLATYITSDGEQQWVLQDTGRGIPDDQLAELGRPFRSRRNGGTGLGLALASEAIGKHGGLLHVESCIGAGTTVTVWLPRACSAHDLSSR